MIGFFGGVFASGSDRGAADAAPALPQPRTGPASRTLRRRGSHRAMARSNRLRDAHLGAALQSPGWGFVSMFVLFVFFMFMVFLLGKYVKVGVCNVFWVFGLYWWVGNECDFCGFDLCDLKFIVMEVVNY